MDGDLWKFGVKPGDPAREEKRGSSFDKADIQIPGQALKGAQLLRRLVGQFQYLTGTAIQMRPSIGDGKMALPADEELNTEFIFQALELRG